MALSPPSAGMDVLMYRKGLKAYLDLKPMQINSFLIVGFQTSNLTKLLND